MKLTEELRTQIVAMQTVGDALRLLKAYAADDPDLEQDIRKITYGIDKRFHYRWYEEKPFIEKEKGGYIILKGGEDTEMSYEELWDEIDNRIAHAQRVLLEHLQDDDAFVGRGEV